MRRRPTTNHFHHQHAVELPPQALTERAHLPVVGHVDTKCGPTHFAMDDELVDDAPHLSVGAAVCVREEGSVRVLAGNSVGMHGESVAVGESVAECAFSLANRASTTHRVDRNGEADAHVARHAASTRGLRGENGGVDSDELTPRVEQRPSRVSRVDRGVRLDPLG